MHDKLQIAKNLPGERQFQTLLFVFSLNASCLADVSIVFELFVNVIVRREESHFHDDTLVDFVQISLFLVSIGRGASPIIGKENTPFYYQTLPLRDCLVKVPTFIISVKQIYSRP